MKEMKKRKPEKFCSNEIKRWFPDAQAVLFIYGEVSAEERKEIIDDVQKMQEQRECKGRGRIKLIISF